MLFQFFIVVAVVVLMIVIVFVLQYKTIALICSGRCHHLWNIGAHIGPPQTLMKTFAFEANMNENCDQNRFCNSSGSL